MFVKFLHKEINEVRDWQQKLIRIYDLYIQKDFGLESGLQIFLNDLIQYYKDQHIESSVTWAQGLLSEFLTAKKGIHPFSLERISTRRHELLMTTCYKIIQNINDKFLAQMQKLQQTQQEAETLLKQILLGGIQLQILTPEMIHQADNQVKCAAIWQTMMSVNNGMQQLTRSLSLMVSTADVCMIMENMAPHF
jgi:hypothetical protein